MIEKINLSEKHLVLAHQVFAKIEDQLEDRFVISIGGESGCGKSTLSYALKTILSNQNFQVHILHMDDYFHLPPKETHQKRLDDISVVGQKEVNLSLLQKHINLYKSGANSFLKPLIHFKENTVSEETLHFNQNSILILEGTYTTQLKGIDCKIFMARDFKDTYMARMTRGRDQGTDFVESVLALEHALIAPHVKYADIVINKDYGLAD